MGLFDFFSRGAGSSNSSGTEPRCDHYSFAHRILREAAFRNPTECVTSLASPDGRQYLQQLWYEVDTACREYDQPVEISLDDILIHKLRLGAFPCTVVEMPAPQFSTEAFFVAIVLTVDMTATSQSLTEKSIRYLTLENGEPDEEKVETILGEWLPGGRHVSLGAGPYPELSGFVATVTELVAEQNSAE